MVKQVHEKKKVKKTAFELFPAMTEGRRFIQKKCIFEQRNDYYKTMMDKHNKMTMENAICNKGNKTMTSGFNKQFFENVSNNKLLGVKCVIQASTNAMYENETGFPTREQFDNLPTLIYPNTKYCAERFAQSYCDTYGMNVCCVRFANVYGPHVDCLRKQPPFVGYLIRELYYDRVPTFHSNGKQARDYIYVDDLTDLLEKVQNCKGFDVVNCSSNKSYSVREIYDIAQDIMHIHC